MVNDHGAIEPFILPTVALLAGVATVVFAVGGLLVRHQQAVGVADLAVLAAASDGGCASAISVATDNGGTVTSCTSTGSWAQVRVRVPTGLAGSLIHAGAPAYLEAVARAGL